MTDPDQTPVSGPLEDSRPTPSGESDAVVLAVDGGGTKTDIAALTLDGRLLAKGRGPSSNPQTQGLETAVAVVDRLISDLLADLDGRRVAQTNIYLSGLDLPAEIEAIQAALSARPWWPKVGTRPVIDNDLFALLRAGTSEPNAVAVICGTGLNAIGVRADGATARFPALGIISGDWGGGSVLGELALWHAARSEDQRGPRTILEHLVPQAFGLDTVGDVAEAVHFSRISQSAITRLTPLLFDAAADGDEVALSVVHRQAEEIVLMVLSILRRLDLRDRAIPLVLGGGVLAAKDEQLISKILEGLAESAPLVEPRIITAPPVLGAALLALESAGADRDACERARRELTATAKKPAGRPSLAEADSPAYTLESAR